MISLAILREIQRRLLHGRITLLKVQDLESSFLTTSSTLELAQALILCKILTKNLKACFYRELAFAVIPLTSTTMDRFETILIWTTILWVLKRIRRNLHLALDSTQSTNPASKSTISRNLSNSSAPMSSVSKNNLSDLTLDQASTRQTG